MKFFTVIAIAVVVIIVLACGAAAKSKKIMRDSTPEHFVVLMLENRAFDHFVGTMAQNDSRITGLTNMSRYNEYKGVKYYVNTTSPYVASYDPHHSWSATTMEIFDTEYPTTQEAKMSGFVREAASTGQHPPEEVMNAFLPHRVPAITTLARTYALFNHFHSSAPADTFINRVFVHMGHSDRKVVGSDIEVLEGWKGTTMYDLFDKYNISWRAYFNDASDLWVCDSMRKLDQLHKFHFFEQFKEDAAAGTLPKFSWVSPRFLPDFGKPASDDHPRHNVVDGEELIAEVYAAVRNSPKWEKTALLITFDEHGGYSDQVPPPSNAPHMPPSTDQRPDQKPFDFTRLGVRIPTILVSPWVEKNTVVQKPEGSTSSYEGTSIYNTLRNLWGFPNEPLSARQRWAAPYDHLLSRSTPRTDCPTSVPTPPQSKEDRALEALRQRALEPGDLQTNIWHMVEGMHGRDGKNIGDFKTAGQMGDHIRAEVGKILDKAKAAKKPLADLKH